jgi:uncharacterized membrane protein (DUF4010 family)
MDFSVIEWTTQLRFAVALALGFLVGLERESIKSEQKFVFGGVRTHPIISMFGFACAWLYKSGATFMLPAGMLAIGALTAIAYVAKIRAERFGSTSEISALLTFVIGALAYLADIWIAMAVGVVNTILLSEKAMLESYVDRLSRVDFLATVKFLLVTVIILPVLPNQEFTLFHINPTKVWHLVIIVSTLGFVGYLLERKFGPRLGLWMSGLLGGIVSSTAVTLSVGRMARNKPELAGSALQASILASSMMYLRILALIWFITPGFLDRMWFRLVILAVIGVLFALRVRHPDEAEHGSDLPDLQNPFEIRPAIGFALLFVLLSVVTMFIRQQTGDTGLVAFSAVVGFSDVTPFIVSVIQGADGTMRVLTTAIIISMMSNTIARGIYFAYLVPAKRRETLSIFAVWAFLHLPLILF